MNVTQPRGRPRALTDKAIARAVLDAGFTGLTFAAVRERLGVGESTLYRYAPDRDALVRTAMEYVLTEASWPTMEGPWRGVLAEHALAVWHLLAQHPGAATEAGRGVYPPRMMRLFTDLVAYLIREGFTSQDAVLACDLVMDLVTDHQQGVERRALAAVTPPETDTQADVDDAVRFALSDDPLAWVNKKLCVVLDGIACSLAPK